MARTGASSTFTVTLSKNASHMRAQLGHRRHGGGEILARHGGRGLGRRGVDRLDQFPLLGLPVEPVLGGALVFRIVALFLDAQDVGGALVAGQQVFPILGVEKFAQRLDPADDEEQVVLAFEGEHGIDEIVAGTLLAELDLEAIGEEGKKINTI